VSALRYKARRSGPVTYLPGPDANEIKPPKLALPNDVKVELHAAECMEHYYEHGDYTQLTRLVLSCNSIKKKRELIEWCEAFAGLDWSTKKQSFLKNKTRPKKQITATLIARPRSDISHVASAQFDEPLIRAHAVDALRHCRKHGDSTKIFALLQLPWSRKNHSRLFGWFQQVGSISYAGHGVFRFKKVLTDKNFEEALKTRVTDIAATVSTSFSKSSSASVSGKCKVCGRSAMLGEDVCYHDQSG
jgi:hypothetical protein